MSKNIIDPKDHESFVKQTWIKMKKFEMVTTGSIALDNQCLKFFGPWLSPSQEYRAICREISQTEAKLLQSGCDEVRLKNHLKMMLDKKTKRISDGVTDPVVGKDDNEYTISIKKIPYEDKETGDLRFMKLRQILMNVKPVTDSGRYRITYVKRQDRYSVIDESNGKRLHTFDSTELINWLKHFFNPNEVNDLYTRFWEEK